MSVFVDTNVLLRSVQPSHPMHDAAVRAVAGLIRDGEVLVVTPQIVAEFWNVVTRPIDKNGLGLSHQAAHAEVVKLEEFCAILAESIDVYTEWKRLVRVHSVSGVQVHDARLVAAMTVHGVDRLLTFNTSDFARYPEIQTLTPV
jgi:predicted nucleic acid-binding protein